MNARSILLALLLATLSPLARATDTAQSHGPHWPDVVSIERSFETVSNAVLLPSSDTGTLTVTPCPKCIVTTLSVNAQTRYLIGADVVALGELKRRLSGQADVPMMVFAALNDPIVLRVVASLPTPPATKTR